LFSGWAIASLDRTALKRFKIAVNALSLVLVVACGSLAFAQDFRSTPTEVPGGEEIINKFLSAMQQQQTALRGVSMQVEISAEVPKLQKQGKLQALRKVSNVGKITYNALQFIGDKTIKNEVIAKYLNADTEVQTSTDDISITPANYKFKFKGLQDRDGIRAYVFQVSPHHKKVGLYKGDLWIDPQTYMPLRESGRFVKSPSIFLKKIEFVRTFNLKDGIAVPEHLESKLQTRIFGPVNLNIDFSNFAKSTDPEVATTAGATAQ
jgi:3-deoxy-D-manno-octulosonate 8-phosphate phosphatase KdsC-like HAD superfamily phosphatase